jgi:hypothetical protein
MQLTKKKPQLGRLIKNKLHAGVASIGGRQLYDKTRRREVYPVGRLLLQVLAHCTRPTFNRQTPTIGQNSKSFDSSSVPGHERRDAF